MQQNRSIKEITVNKLFAGVSESLILSFLKQDSFNSLKEGKIIYQAGDESKYLYLLLRGDVKIKYPGVNYVSNKNFNDFFGEKEIVDETRRISSAVANSNCLIYKIGKKLFRKLIAKNTTLNSNLENYGEIHLPEISSEVKPTFNFNGASKPISFSATSNIIDREGENNIKTENPADLTPEPPVAGVKEYPDETILEVQEETSAEKIEFVPKPGETEPQENDDLEIDSDNIDLESDAGDADLKIEQGDTILDVENIPEQDIESMEEEVIEEEEKEKDCCHQSQP